MCEQRVDEPPDDQLVVLNAHADIVNPTDRAAIPQQVGVTSAVDTSEAVNDIAPVTRTSPHIRISRGQGEADPSCNAYENGGGARIGATIPCHCVAGPGRGRRR